MTSIEMDEPLHSAHFTQVVETHYAALYDYGMRLCQGDEALAKDCIQEVFLHFWNKRATWTGMRSEKAYLLVSLRHGIIDAYRKNRRSLAFVSLSEADEPVAVFDLLFEESSEAPREQLTQLLNKLPRRQREALYLRYFAEMDYPEVAAAMGVKERTVYNLVHEGLNSLRQTVAESPAQWTALLRSFQFFLKIFVG